MADPMGLVFLTFMILSVYTVCHANRVMTDLDESSDRFNHFQITKLDQQILEEIHEIVFDSMLNTYVRTPENLYKFNKKNSINYVFDNVNSKYSESKKIIINKHDDVYLFTTNSSRIDLWRISRNSFPPDRKLLSFPKTYYAYKDDKYFIDKRNNIYFNTENGVAILQANRNVLVEVKNLHDFNFDKIDEDEAGNVYLVNNDNVVEDGGIYLIAQKDKNKVSNVSATKIPTIDDTTVRDFKIWNNICFISEYRYEEQDIGIVKTLYSKFDEFLIWKNDVQYYFLDEKNKTSNRLFIRENNNLHFIALTGGSLKAFQVEIPSDCWIMGFNKGSYAINKKGTAYFTCQSHWHIRSKLLMLEPEETKFKEIDMPNEEEFIYLAFDRCDNLWILSNELYLLEKEESKPIQISKTGEIKATSRNSFLEIKEDTNEVYVYAPRRPYYPPENRVLFVVKRI